MRVESDGIRDWQPLLDRLRQVPHVTAAAPGIYGQVLVSRGPRAGFALIKGIVPARSGPSATCWTPSSPARPKTNPETAKPDTGSRFPVKAPPTHQHALSRPGPGQGLAEQIGAQVGDSVLSPAPRAS
jgi:lipoprotein-releasing system permease protein